MAATFRGTVGTARVAYTRSTGSARLHDAFTRGSDSALLEVPYAGKPFVEQGRAVSRQQNLENNPGVEIDFTQPTWPEMVQQQPSQKPVVNISAPALGSPGANPYRTPTHSPSRKSSGPSQ